MTSDRVESARLIVAALERSDAATVSAARSDTLLDWDPGPWIAERWHPRLGDVAGARRRVDDARIVNETMCRVVITGDRGQGFVSVLLDPAGKLAGLAIDPDERDGRAWVVIGCRDGRRDELEAFYTALVDGPLGFGEGGSRPPVWPDADHPVQLHLDLAVADMDLAEREVTGLGAIRLAAFPGRSVWADPAGHPFCLITRATASAGDRIGVLENVVIDCAEPEPLAAFWSQMLDLPRRVSVTPDRIEVASIDGRRPGIVAQRIDDHRPPRWPDPEHPQQLHLDLGYDDRPATERLALELGATRLPPHGGSCPVYADPAGHPFCLCYKGE